MGQRKHFWVLGDGKALCGLFRQIRETNIKLGGVLTRNSESYCLTLGRADFSAQTIIVARKAKACAYRFHSTRMVESQMVIDQDNIVTISLVNVPRIKLTFEIQCAAVIVSEDKKQTSGVENAGRSQASFGHTETGVVEIQEMSVLSVHCTRLHLEHGCKPPTIMLKFNGPDGSTTHAFPLRRDGDSVADIIHRDTHHIMYMKEPVVDGDALHFFISPHDNTLQLVSQRTKERRRTHIFTSRGLRRFESLRVSLVVFIHCSSHRVHVHWLYCDQAVFCRIMKDVLFLRRIDAENAETQRQYEGTSKSKLATSRYHKFSHVLMIIRWSNDSDLKYKHVIISSTELVVF